MRGSLTLALVVVRLKAVSGSLTVISGSLPLTVKTAPYIFYGPQGSNAKITAPARFMDGLALCHVDPETVRGKIVITSGIGADCTWDEMYLHLDDAGAVGLVRHMFPKTTGISCFRHRDWDMKPFLERQLMWVTVPEDEIDLDLWESAATAGDGNDLVLELAGPHSVEYYDLFTGPAWTLCIRCLLPMFGVYTAWMAWCQAGLVQLKIEAQQPGPKRDIRGVGVVVCLIEAPSIFLLSIAAAFGQWGPTALPDIVHHVFYTFLLGTCLSSTILLVLVMREQRRMLASTTPNSSPIPPQQPEQQSASGQVASNGAGVNGAHSRFFWKTHWRFLVVVGVVGVGADVVMAVGRTVHIAWIGYRLFYGIMAATYMVRTMKRVTINLKT